MWNLLSGEFYKLRKSKVFYVCMMSMIVMVVWLYGMILVAEKIEQGEMQNGQMGVVVEVNSQPIEENSALITERIGIMDMYQQVAGNLTTFIAAIFTSIFVIGEFGNGAVKNLVGKGKNRSTVYFAKYIAVEAVTILLSFIGAVTTFFVGCVMLGTEEVNGAFVQNYIIYALCQTVLVMTIDGVITATSEMLRSMSMGVVTALCIVGGVSGLVFMGIDLVLKLVHIPVRLNDYWLTELMVVCPLDGIDGTFLRRLVIGVIVWTVVALGAGLEHFKKADIK